MAIEQIVTPFYSDWKFWSFIASGVAIVLSQLPPIRILVQSMGLTVEAYSQLFVTHKYGNPNGQLHLIVLNSGGRKVRVSGITLQITPGTGKPFSMPAAAYYQKQGDTSTVLFTPFTVLPGEEWAHITCFFPSLTRADDKLIRDSKAVLRNDLHAKRELLEDKKERVTAEPESVAPFIDLSNRQFKWLPDEYEMAVSFTTDPPNAVADQRFRFVLFESDTKEMRSVEAEYKYGGGIFFEPDNDSGIAVALQKLKNGEHVQRT
jgi:hypothetical protein